MPHGTTAFVLVIEAPMTRGTNQMAVALVRRSRSAQFTKSRYELRCMLAFVENETSQSEPSPWLKYLGYFIWYVICPLIPVLVLFAFLDNLYGIYRESAEVNGVVTFVSAEPVITRDEDHDQDEITIVYEYVVQGKTYSSSRWCATWMTKDKLTVWFPLTYYLLPKYPIGQSVLVHYDPDQPAKSCLQRGVHFLPLAMMLLCSGVIISMLNQKYRWAWHLSNQGFGGLCILLGVVICLCGPIVLGLWSLLIYAGLALIFSTPGWKWICKLIGWKPPVSDPEPYQADLEAK